MKSVTSPVRALGLSGLCLVAGLSMSSCVVGPPPPPPGPPPGPPVVAVGIGPVRVLPVGARRVYWRGERCWVRNGVYYRRHPRGGYVVIR